MGVGRAHLNWTLLVQLFFLDLVRTIFAKELILDWFVSNGSFVIFLKVLFNRHPTHPRSFSIMVHAQRTWFTYFGIHLKTISFHIFSTLLQMKLIILSKLVLWFDRAFFFLPWCQIVCNGNYSLMVECKYPSDDPTPAIHPYISIMPLPFPRIQLIQYSTHHTKYSIFGYIIVQFEHWSKEQDNAWNLSYFEIPCILIFC